MLLDLFAAECEGREVSVSSLCLAAGGCGTAPTTALRHISRLEKLRIVIRIPDPDDRRRCFMRLAPEIGPKLERWLLETWRSEERRGGKECVSKCRSRWGPE